ncbi:hypothetical protein YN1HA_16690 [Sulfurisphaera ohwakuensis]
MRPYITPKPISKKTSKKLKETNNINTPRAIKPKNIDASILSFLEELG